MRDMTPATPLSQPATAPVDGASVVIEAATAEAALTELHSRLGADARIIEVRRVARGGIGGFFAREMVELHAAPGVSAASVATAAAPAVPAAAAPAPAPAPAPASAPAPAPAPAPAAVTAATSPIDRLLQADADVDDTVDFATFLRSQLATAPAAPSPAPAPAVSTHEALLERATAAARDAVRAATGEGGGVVDPTTDRVVGVPVQAPTPAPAPVPAPAVAAYTEAARQVTTVQVADPAPVVEPDPIALVAAVEELTTDAGELTEPAAAFEPGPAWSVGALIKLGLPASLVRGLEVDAPADDVAWTAALAGALRPLCRPLPTGRSLLVGPRARSLAKSLGIPTATAGQPIRSRAATVAAGVGSGAASQRWLERVRGNRWLHVVVGGAGWRELLHLDPLAVSWAAREDVPEALRLATELGLVLGSGPLDGEVRRARPLDLALAVRALLPETTGAEAGEQL